MAGLSEVQRCDLFEIVEGSGGIVAKAVDTQVAVAVDTAAMANGVVVGDTAVEKQEV